MDFCGPLPTGDYLMVLIDEFSRYPVVEIVRSVSASVVIPVLDKVLSVFGFPTVLKSDNGIARLTRVHYMPNTAVSLTDVSRLSGQEPIRKQKLSISL